MEFSELLTVGGAAALVIMLTGLVKRTFPAFDSERFGPIVATGFGIAIVLLANWATVGDLHLDFGPALFTGALAGLSAAGLYDVGASVASS